MKWEQSCAQFPWNINLENHLLIDFLGSNRKLMAKTRAGALAQRALAHASRRHSLS